MGWFDDFIAAEKNPVRLMWGALPPNVRDAYSSGARSLATVAGEVSPGAAFRDAGQESVNMMDAAREGNWMDAAAGPAKMATAMAGIVPIFKGAKMATNVAQEAIAPIRAYHGSPHSFDRFDISKIGTGEGAQAYGHGLYFAENPTVASSYKNPNQRPVPITYGDAEFSNTTIRGRTLDDMNLIGKDAALQKLKDNIRFNEKYAPDMARLYQGELDWAAGVDPSKIKVPRGHMYEVGIHADPAKMLDWDKPLSGQSADIQRIARESYTPDAVARDLPGGTIYRGMLGTQDHPSMASDFFKEAGIPGIRYLDGGSRSAGQGSSNYVVFDPSIIEILKKYGLLPATVAAGVGGASMLPTDNAPQGGLF